MSLLTATLTKIQPPDTAAIKQAKHSLKKRGLKLGELEKIYLNYIGITRQANPPIPQKCTIVTCADHGVAAMGVSAYPPETTVEMTRNYLVSRGAVANALSNFAHSQLYVVDMGVAASTENIPGIIDRKIALGTKNIAKGPAMSREEAVKALEIGIELVNTLISKGYRCFLPGEMGIANTTSSAAIAAVYGNLPPEKATGRGTNISDERLKLKIEVVRQAITVNQPDKNDGIDMLAKLGGFELGCIAGIMLGAAANHAVVMLDGFNTGAAALIATSLNPLVRHYLIGSHLAAEQAHIKMLELLQLTAYMKMDFRLGEATGSSIAINLLDAAIRFSSAEAPVAAVKPILLTDTINLPATDSLAIAPFDQLTADKCSLYIDNLAKPIHSLGRLEELAIKLAGITSQTKPAFMDKELVLFTDSSAAINSSVISAAVHANAQLSPFLLTEGCPDFTQLGYTAVRQSALQRVICLGAACSTANETALIQAYHGAILAGAELHCPIVIDGLPALKAAELAIQDNVNCSSYIIMPAFQYTAAGQQLSERLGFRPCLKLGMIDSSLCLSALASCLIDAALHMVNDMKTFGSAGVSVANDGPGANRQDKAIK